MSKPTHTRKLRSESATLAVIEHGLDTAQALAEDLGRSEKTARRYLDGAVMLGLLERRSHIKNGGLAYYYRPTSEGRKLLDKAINQPRKR